MMMLLVLQLFISVVICFCCFYSADAATVFMARFVSFHLGHPVDSRSSDGIISRQL